LDAPPPNDLDDQLRRPHIAGLRVLIENRLQLLQPGKQARGRGYAGQVCCWDRASGSRRPGRFPWPLALSIARAAPIDALPDDLIVVHSGSLARAAMRAVKRALSASGASRADRSRRCQWRRAEERRGVELQGKRPERRRGGEASSMPSRAAQRRR
jgi:hypothetical protein